MNEFRSALFVPGSSEKMLGKAGGLTADLILFDLEDSVLLENKAVARAQVAEKVAELKFRGSSQAPRRAIGVRINDLTSGHLLADIKAILPASPDLLLIPKVQDGSDLAEIDRILADVEAEIGIGSASTKLLILAAETAMSLFKFDSLTNVSNRLIGMTWGAEDLASELGAKQARDPAGGWLPPSQLAQTFCLAKSRELGIQSLDTVYPDVRDLEGLRRECLAAKQMGFTGKLAIHPAQVAVIDEVFSPSQEELDRAQQLVDLFAENPNSGALQLDGQMVDLPHLRAAERLLQTHNVKTHKET